MMEKFRRDKKGLGFSRKSSTSEKYFTAFVHASSNVDNIKEEPVLKEEGFIVKTNIQITSKR